MIKKIAKPQMTSYDCMLLIFSTLVKKGKTILRQDTLVSKLYKYKNMDKTKGLFEDIAFKNSIDSVITSVDVEDGLSKLQAFGAIGKLNPAYEKIVIYISEQEATEFINSFPSSLVEAANIISEDIKNEGIKAKQVL